VSKYTVTIGADPEFFVREKKTGLVVPACRKFGGEKRAPMFLSPDGGYLEDGCAVEFNVTPSKSLKDCRKKLQDLMLIFLNQHKDYIISEDSHATFRMDDLVKLPEAMCIGCSPDLFAYGLRNAPSIERFGASRFAGGHVHLGIDPWPEGLDKANAIKMMDALLIFPMCGFVDVARYPFYGHPGLYRETPYGVEHRSPDNWWCNDAKFNTVKKDYQGYFHDVIEEFDKAIVSMSYILNFDGHGARLNDDLERAYKNWKMSDLGDLGSTERAITLNTYRRCGNDLRYMFKHWVGDRAAPRGQGPRSKGKAVIGG